MASTRNDMARQAYKRAVLQFLAATAGLDNSSDAGVAFWATEARRVLDRQSAKLADIQLGEYKRVDPSERDTLLAERDATARAAASARKGNRAAIREARESEHEAWARLELAERTARSSDGNGCAGCMGNEPCPAGGHMCEYAREGIRCDQYLDAGDPPVGGDQPFFADDMPADWLQ